MSHFIEKKYAFINKKNRLLLPIHKTLLSLLLTLINHDYSSYSIFVHSTAYVYLTGFRIRSLKVILKLFACILYVIRVIFDSGPDSSDW